MTLDARIAQIARRKPSLRWDDGSTRTSIHRIGGKDALLPTVVWHQLGATHTPVAKNKRPAE